MIMRIHLKEDAKPFAITTLRLILLALQVSVKNELESMVAQGIITPAREDPSSWCHPLVAVAKPNRGVKSIEDGMGLVLKGGFAFIYSTYYGKMLVATHYTDRTGDTPVHISTSQYDLFFGNSFGMR
ncbi:hypothetical protein Pcinc_010408 [Petrolisthes cinctipes]|uniref:Uncharacterized protein n=1 Tax=Petrolisthes cinctipes TaxID=88211 RepID=A0AAE1G5F8_PETCI|nr:hypothetical protein Pcinc_010408 [Petrolisthes cinctipes]